MSEPLDKRLYQILPRITSDTFLEASGLGNEIAFHIFDYPPENELQVRKHIVWLLEQIPRQRPNTRVVHVNLFEFLCHYLQKRKLLERAFKMHREKGDAALLRALKGPLDEKRLADEFIAYAQPAEYDLVVVSGVGSVYRLISSSALLNTLQPVMPDVPLLMFYPGRYDGTTLRIFGKSSISQARHRGKGDQQTPYYRAFRLIPEESKYAY